MYLNGILTLYTVLKLLTELSNEDLEFVKGYIPKSLKLQFRLLCTKNKSKCIMFCITSIKEWVQADTSRIRC